MTINKAIEQVDQLCPNVYGEEQKVEWLNTLDGMIAKIVMQGAAEVRYAYPGDMDRELLVPAPFDGMYALYIRAMIHFYNKEYTDYNNMMLMFNAQLDEYKKLYIRENMPVQHGSFKNMMG